MRNNTHTADENTSIEGVCGLIKYTGHTDSVIKAINANLRAGMSYCGARNWEEFKEKAVMRLMSTAGIVEKETHLEDTIR
jgi:IMP dehydrogenase